MTKSNAVHQPVVGHVWERLESVPSTNTLVMEDEDRLNTHGLVVSAEHQTAGRGQHGRHWESVAGQHLQFSVVLHPPLQPAELPALSLCIGVAVARALEAHLGLEPRLKWPNDVLLAGRKVCGILVESKPSPVGLQRTVVGIGLNCNGAREQYPEELRGRITTLAAEAQRSVDREALLQVLLLELEQPHQTLKTGGLRPVLEAWRERGHLRGTRVRIATPAGTQSGRPLGINAEGYLQVATDDGAQHTVVSGQVEWL